MEFKVRGVKRDIVRETLCTSFASSNRLPSTQSNPIMWKPVVNQNQQTWASCSNILLNVSCFSSKRQNKRSQLVMYQTFLNIQVCSHPGALNDESHLIINWRRVDDCLLCSGTSPRDVERHLPMCQAWVAKAANNST